MSDLEILVRQAGEICFCSGAILAVTVICLVFLILIWRRLRQMAELMDPDGSRRAEVRRLRAGEKLRTLAATGGWLDPDEVAEAGAAKPET